MKKNKKTILKLGILVGVFALISAASVIYTERPKFCATCHIMKPYYSSWKQSVHKDISCLECHYEPTLKAHLQGKINGLVQVAQYLTHRYSGKPNARVSDASCLREGCHKKEDLKNKKIIFRDKVNFRHARHFDNLKAGIQARCTSCHTQITCDEHMTVDTNACFICHFKGVSGDQLAQQCLRCHAVIKDEPAHKKEYLASGSKCTECHNEAKKGDAAVRKQTCYFCHAEKEKIGKIKDYKLMHQAHVEKDKLACVNCHEIIEHN